jgi:hypothetical protein
VPLAAEGQPNSIEPDLNSLLREGAPSYEDLTAPALLEHRRFAERTSDPDSLD